MTRAFYTRTIDASFTDWVIEQTRVTLGADVKDWQPLPVEASFRQFFRIQTGKDTLVAMHAPPTREDTAQFVRIAKLFKAHGIGVPVLYSQDVERGFVLMEDLGDTTFECAYGQGQTDRALDLALNTLLRIQGIEDAASIIPKYEAQRLRMELGIFSEWFVGALLGSEPPHWYSELSELLVKSALEQPQCPIHRDFHCRNLLIRPSGEIGIVDFQDALIGPVTYDLASLLGDCYHEIAPSKVTRALMVHHRAVRAQRVMDSPDEARFRADFEKMVIQRQLKAVGIFSRLWLRDGKKSHLGSIAPVLTRLAKRCRGFDFADNLALLIEREWLPLAISRTQETLS